MKLARLEREAADDAHAGEVRLDHVAQRAERVLVLARALEEPLREARA